MRRLAWLGACAIASTVSAQDVAFSAKVDKTAAKIGEPVTLTITVSGDVSGVEVPAFQFPDGFAVLGRSQETNFSVRAGAVQRSTNLIYVLVPQQAGTFQLGPFTVSKGKLKLSTDPIEVTVKKPPVPPGLKPSGERFTL